MLCDDELKLPTGLARSGEIGDNVVGRVGVEETVEELWCGVRRCSLSAELFFGVCMVPGGARSNSFHVDIARTGSTYSEIASLTCEDSVDAKGRTSLGDRGVRDADGVVPRLVLLSIRGCVEDAGGACALSVLTSRQLDGLDGGASD